ncbi:MAG: hypothetical protein ACXVHS_03365 [Methanobacterium sp.]
MEMDQFMEIIENSGEFDIDEPPADSDVMYKTTHELTAITINDFLINPSKIGIKGASINFWVNPSFLGWDMNNDILIGTIIDVKNVKTLIID